MRRMVSRHGGQAPAGAAADDPALPGAAAPAAGAHSYRLRAVVNYGYPDAFPAMRESGTFFREAAE